jgi:stress response protein YsnF
MTDIDTVRGWRGRTMVDRDGDRIGTIQDLYADDQTGQPEWALVNTGLFGTKSTFVPLAQATTAGDDVQVPYQKQLVKDAPRVEADQHLSQAEEQQLWRHYGLDDQPADRTAEAATGAEGYDRAATGRDDAMTRSEEELQVGTRPRERGRVRLRKYVTTEQEQVTVPVQREEVRVEREPITDANLDAAMAGPELAEAEHEVTLQKDTVTGEEQVAEELRKEQIDVEGEDQLRRDQRP